VANVVFAVWVVNVVVVAIVPGQHYLTRSCVIVANVSSKLVPTGVAADAIGVDRGTLHRWWKVDGLVQPTLVTAGGHARWDIDDLKRQLRERRKTDG
jgi:hypothetical protein